MGSKKSKKKKPRGRTSKSTVPVSQLGSRQGTATAPSAHTSPAAASAPATSLPQALSGPKQTIGGRLRNWSARFTKQQKAAAAVVSVVLAYLAVAGITFPSWAEKWREWFPAWTSERTGYLIPANAPMPAYPTCGKETIPGSVNVYLGANVFLLSKKGARVPVMVIEDVPVVELEYTHKGQLKVWASVMDSNGALQAKLGDDLDWVADRRVGGVRRSSSQVVVTGPSSEDVFDVRFLNPTAIEIAGEFSAKGSPVVVTANARGIRFMTKDGGSTVLRGNCVVNGKPLVVKDGEPKTLF